ncbi:hypothetical protein [Devosia sp. CN2-171]|jgi:hypothetical protein|uniref:hypothetical protein n=1 Tax=Devosia sp. CN2-171 TaxID=3400909 RepID=UPI003BF7B972
MADWIPWVNLGLNVTGAALMVHFGLPKPIPFLGREDSDPIWGLLGLTLFATSIVVRISTILYTAT